MGSKRTIEQLLAVIGTNPTDMAPRLELAERYRKVGDIRNALDVYEEVAKYYASQGLPMKALAIYKQICSMVVADAPHLRRRYAHVPPILAELYEKLGLNDEAVTALDALGDDTGHARS